MTGTVQISPILALAVAALEDGGLGGVREARAELSAAAAPQRAGSIRTGQASWATPRGWSVSRCPRQRWVMP